MKYIVLDLELKSCKEEKGIVLYLNDYRGYGSQIPGALEYSDCISVEVVRLPPTNEGPEYGTKPSDDEARVLELWGCVVLLHCHYSQIHSDPEWNYLLGFAPRFKENELIIYCTWNQLNCVQTNN